MFPRVGGAILALAAAALLAVAVLATPWWLGHPSVDSQAPRRLQTIDVGPLGAHGCNTGGDGKCSSMTLTQTSKIAGLGTAGTAGLLAIGLVVLAMTTLKRSDARRPIGKVVLAGVVVGIVVGGVLLALGPGIKATGHSVTVPKGMGFLVFFAGAATAIAAALVTAREIPRALFIPKPAPGPGPFDVRALIGDDQNQLRPSQPNLQQPQHQDVARSPGGVLPGPSGPLQPPAQPLFASAPQLRPLYEMEGHALGPVTPMLPDSAPTPLPQNARELMNEGLLRPRTSSQLPAPRGKPASLPPPASTRPAVVPPPPVIGRPAIPLPPIEAPPPSPPGPLGPAAFTPFEPAFSAKPPPGPPSSPFSAQGAPSASRSAVQPAQPGPRTQPPFSSPFPQQPAPPAIPPRIPSPTRPPAPAKPTPTPFDIAAVKPSGAPFGVLPPPAQPKPFSLPRPPTTNTADDLMETHERRPEARGDTNADDGEQRPPTATDDHTSPGLSIASDDAAKLGDDSDEAAERVALGLDTTAEPALPASDVTEDSPPMRNPGDAAIGVARTEPVAIAASEPAAMTSPAQPIAHEPRKIPVTTASDQLPPPTGKQAQSTGPSPACPQCEAPMAWVEAHLRFYCKSCRMYF